MDFEQSLAYELQAISGLSGKVFPSMTNEEDEKPPFVVYISSGGEPIMALSGATNLTEVTCEIHIVAETYAQLKTYSKQVLERIRGFFQRKIGQDGVYIKSVSHTEPIEDIENNSNYHRCSFDIRIRF